MAWFGALIVFTAQGSDLSAGFTPISALSLIVAAIVLFGLPGWLAYTGKWQRWTSSPHGATFPYMPFGMAWMGIGGILVGIFGLLSALGNVAAAISALIFGLPGIAMFCCGLVFAIRTPHRFLPAWYREFRQYSRERR